MNPCTLLMSFRCIKAFMHAFSGRFSRTCLEGISFNFFVCFIFNVSLGSAPKRKNFDIQRNTRVASGGQFTSNRLSNDHTLTIQRTSAITFVACNTSGWLPAFCDRDRLGKTFISSHRVWLCTSKNIYILAHCDV